MKRRASNDTCLCLPDCEGGSGESRKHVTTPRHPDRDDGAMYVVLYCLDRRACLGRVRAIPLFYPILTIGRGLGFSLILRLGVRPSMRSVRLLVFDAIVRGVRAPRIRTFSGREDRGRRDGPIRHGGLPQAMAAFARAHLNAGMYASRSSC